MKHVLDHLIQNVDIFKETEEMVLETIGDSQCSSVVMKMIVCKFSYLISIPN